ncbi:MAG: hypothetical protein IKO47_07975 [Ruminococcus sp.]|nr:hypothetical protein [Ruminococcus sp.]
MVIHANGKNIPTYAFGSLFIQGESLADVITFVVDRYYCGKDLSLCDFAVRGVTEENWEANQVLPMEVGERTISLTWNVSDSFTYNAGKLLLELRASETSAGGVNTVVKYSMSPVYVAPTIAGRNGPLPDTAEQAVSEINAAVSEGLEDLQEKIDSLDITEYTAQLTSATEADLELLSEAMDEFGLDEVNARLDKMEEDTQTYLARPEVVALTRAEYEAITPKEDSLYVIIQGGAV